MFCPVARVLTGQGKVREKKYFSRSGKSQGILWTSQGKFCLLEKSGNLRKDKIISGIQEKFVH